MSACPDIAEVLRMPARGSVAEHVRGCAGCRAVRSIAALSHERDVARDCDAVESDLAAALDGVLPSSRRGRLDAHVAACGACRETLVALTLEEPLAAPSAAVTTAAAPSFGERVRAFLTTGSGWQRALMPLAAGLFGIAIGRMGLPEPDPSPQPHVAVESAPASSTKPEPAPEPQPTLEREVAQEALAAERDALRAARERIEREQLAYEEERAAIEALMREREDRMRMAMEEPLRMSAAPRSGGDLSRGMSDLDMSPMPSNGLSGTAGLLSLDAECTAGDAFACLERAKNESDRARIVEKSVRACGLEPAACVDAFELLMALIPPDETAAASALQSGCQSPEPDAEACRRLARRSEGAEAAALWRRAAAIDRYDELDCANAHEDDAAECAALGIAPK